MSANASPRAGLAGLVLLLCGVGIGVLVDRGGWLPGSAGTEPPGLANTFQPFWEAWRLVDKHYVDRQAIDSKRMTQGAILGMLDSLGDTGHTTYLTATEVVAMEKGLRGEMEGIGALLTVRDHRPTIAQTMPGSPARKAGLKPGDALLDVDGKSVVGEAPERVAALVRGKAGTEVRLRVARPGEAHPLDFTITRAKVQVPEVSWQQLPGINVAHLALREFGDHADSQLRQAFQEIQARGIESVIIDVRANPGGLLEQAVAVTSEFLGSGLVLVQQDATGRRIEVPVREGGVALQLHICVLVDSGTASAAEIFAGAIQDHERAKLVGTRTFGTGTVLKRYPLSDGSAVLLAVAEWLTPKGRRIWHEGIKPDVDVALPSGVSMLLPDEEGGMTSAELSQTRDVQLLKAIEVLIGKNLAAKSKK